MKKYNINAYFKGSGVDLSKLKAEARTALSGDKVDANLKLAAEVLNSNALENAWNNPHESTKIMFAIDYLIARLDEDHERLKEVSENLTALSTSTLYKNLWRAGLSKEYLEISNSLTGSARDNKDWIAQEAIILKNSAATQDEIKEAVEDLMSLKQSSSPRQDKVIRDIVSSYVAKLDQSQLKNNIHRLINDYDSAKLIRRNFLRGVLNEVVKKIVEEKSIDNEPTLLERLLKTRGIGELLNEDGPTGKSRGSILKTALQNNIQGKSLIKISSLLNALDEVMATASNSPRRSLPDVAGEWPDDTRQPE